ncbi:MAG: hypothetical protein WCG99_02900 [Candidatus Berkelbacteria bacterium]
MRGNCSCTGCRKHPNHSLASSGEAAIVECIGIPASCSKTLTQMPANSITVENKFFGGIARIYFGGKVIKLPGGGFARCVSYQRRE